MRRSLVALAVLAAGAGAHAERGWLAPDRFGSLHVVVAEDAAEPERVAARRFVQHWERATGAVIEQSSGPVGGAVNVWIGSAARREFPEEFEGRALSSEGGLILGLPRAAGGARRAQTRRDLILAGGGLRGTLTAEWIFFERFLGARVYTPEVFRFPMPERGIPPIDYEFEPPFAYRDTNYRIFLENPWLASLTGLNGQWSQAPAEFGGYTGFVHGLRGFGHTFHDFVNPEEYFAEHPEYFAEIDGERVKESQLCLTNPEVLQISIGRAREFLRGAAPHERILSISQMDYFWFDSWCTCAKCRAVDEEEQSQSGTIIRFVNAVAEAIEGEFPEARVDTFAYLYSRKPPRLTRPRDNVLIRLCAIEADYGRPLADRRSAANRAFVRDLKQWRRIAKHLWVWDYTQNWRAFQAPHPNVPVLQPNLAFFRRMGVDGVFEQASPHSPHSDFELLKAYLIGRGLREPDFDWKRETAEFLEAYYGVAAPHMAEYLALLQGRLRAWGGPLHFVNDLEWMDAETVERAQEIFARAFEATTDETLLQRLRSAYLPVRYAAMLCPPRVLQTPEAYEFVCPPGPTLEEYEAEAAALGVTHLNDYPFDALRRRLNGVAPPRHEVARIHRLSNDRFEVWVVPALGGAVLRWREQATGRDWLHGYDDVASARGRLQEWLTTDAERGSEPEAVSARYRVLREDGQGLMLEAALDEGLVIRKTIALRDDGLETRIEIENTGAAPRTVKLDEVAEFGVREVGVGRPLDEGSGAFRFSRAGRTLIVEAEGLDADGRIEYARESGDTVGVLRVKALRSAIAPGEMRAFVLRHRISAARR